MLKSKRPIDTYYKFMMSKLWVLLCAIIPVGNLAETGLIAFMSRNFQSSTYLKTDRWKPHKVHPVVQRRASIPVVFLLLFVIFSSHDLFVICLCIAACLVFNNISFSFFLFLSFSKYSSLFFSSIFLGIPSVFANQTSPFWIIYINICIINLQQMSYTAGMITPQPHQKQKEF